MGAIGGIIGGVGSIIGGISGRGAARDAARAQERGIQRQIQFETDAFNATNRLLAPQRQIGYGALDTLSRMFLGTGSPLAQSGYETGTPTASIPNLLGGGDSATTVAGGAGGDTLATPVPRTVDNLTGYGLQQLQAAKGVDPGAPDEQLVKQLPITAFNRPAPAPAPSPTDAGGVVEGGTFQPGQEDSDFSSFERSPGYQFRQEEGNKALTNRLSAMGLSESGRGTKDFMRFNQGLASEEFNNFTNQLFTMAGLGNAATSNTANALLSTGSNVGQAMANAGTARASGIVGGQNALMAGFSQLPGAVTQGTQFGQGIAEMFRPRMGPIDPLSMQQFAANSAVGAF